MNSIIMLLKGYVKVCITKGTPERFINICRASGIKIWNISFDENGCIFYTNIKQFKALGDVRRKTGNTYYTDTTLIRYLENNNVSPGMHIADIDCSAIESRIRQDFDDITWVSAEIKGTRLVLHIKENETQIKTIDNDTSARSLIADTDGIIVSIITRTGTPQIKAGDEIKAGDILVSSEVPIIGDNKEVVSANYVRGDADIIIEHNIEYEDLLDEKYVFKNYTGKEKRTYLISIFGIDMKMNLFFNMYDKYVQINNQNSVYLTENFCTPVKTGMTRYIEYEEMESVYSQEQAERILNDNLNIYLKKLEKKGIQIIDSSVKIELTDGVYRCLCSLKTQYKNTGYIDE